MTRKLCIALLILLIIPATLCWAASPSANIEYQISLPSFERQSLLNGLEVYLFPSDSERLDFTLMIINGGAFDPVDKWGVAYLTARMLVESGKDKSGQSLLEALKASGGQLTVKVEPDAIFFEGSAPAGRLADVLNIFGQMVVQPEFSEEALTQVRNDAIAQLETKRKDASFLTQEHFLAELFRANPYSHLVKGTPATLKNVTLADVRYQYKKIFIPNQAYLAFYHTGQAAAAMSGLTRRWGGWVKGASAPFAFRQASAPAATQVVLINKSGQEAVLRCGTLSTPRGDRAQTALEVLREYLTLSLPGWASQVASSQQVRASASLETRKMTGFFQLSIQAPADQIPAYVRRYQQLIADIERGQISREQFEEAKRVVVQEFKNGLMVPSSRLRYVLETHLYGLGVNYISNFGVRVSRITPESFQTTVKEHFSDKKPLIVLSGPREVLEKDLTEFGPVRLLN